jgi:hypothetical protein
MKMRGGGCKGFFFNFSYEDTAKMVFISKSRVEVKHFCFINFLLKITKRVFSKSSG